MTATATATRARYTTVAIILHWLIAAAIIFQIILGWRMGDGPKGPSAYAMFQLHKSIGVTILLLSLGRLAWRLTHRPPPEPPMPKWERLAAKTVHVLFYVVMIGLPLTGWLIVSASRIGVPTLLYGVIPWPHIPGVPELAAGPKAALHEAGELGHGLLVKLTYALLALHLGAVAKHQILDRDPVFSGMAPGARPGWREPRLWLAAAGFIAVVAGAYAYAPRIKHQPEPPAAEAEPVEIQAAPAAPVAPVAPVVAAQAAPQEAAPAAPPVMTDPVAWTVKPGSSLAFTTNWGGEAVQGRFTQWTADILFSPDALDRSRITVKIDLASAATGDAQRDGALPGEDWFDAARHPTAIFTAKTFARTGEGRYVAKGTLDLRGVSRPVSLPFSLKIDGDTARVRGVTSLDRTAFGVGQGEWTSTDQVPAKVSVSVNLTATRK